LDLQSLWRSFYSLMCVLSSSSCLLPQISNCTEFLLVALTEKNKIQLCSFIPFVDTLFLFKTHGTDILLWNFDTQDSTSHHGADHQNLATL
jgi:hypothetical protein